MNRNLLIAGAFAALAAATGAAGLINLNTGAPVGAGPVTIGFAEGYDAAAMTRLNAVQDRGELDSVERKAREALYVAPYATAARLRLAHVDLLRNGRLTQNGLREFERSYDLVPIDPDVGAWRIRFGLETWSMQSPRARQAVYAEAEALRPLHSHENDVDAALRSIQDPAGRLSAALWLNSWKRN